MALVTLPNFFMRGSSLRTLFIKFCLILTLLIIAFTLHMQQNFQTNRSHTKDQSTFDEVDKSSQWIITKVLDMARVSSDADQDDPPRDTTIIQPDLVPTEAPFEQVLPSETVEQPQVNGTIQPYLQMTASTFQPLGANSTKGGRYMKSTSFNKTDQIPVSNLTYTFKWFSSKFWKSIKPSVECPPKFLQRLGNKSTGGKWVCGINHLKNSSEACTIYSFVIDSKGSFETDILPVNSNCKVFVFNPFSDTSSPDSQITFQQIRLGQVPSITVEGVIDTLKNIMDKNGHDWIDLVKISVEGGEGAIFENVLKDFSGPLPFGQLQIELHSESSTNVTLGLIHKFQERGLRLFHYEPHPVFPASCAELAFLNAYSIHLYLDEESISNIII